MNKLENKIIKKKRHELKKPELLAPVGNWEMLVTAIDSGADAIYLGVKGFNMRATAKNFSLSELKKIVSKCHKNNIKVYLTLNIIVYENEIPKAEKIIRKAKEYGVDAIICWDFSVIQIAKKIGINFHISTQASISNSESANFFYELGAERCVLARECSLDDIKTIRKKTKIGLEVFGHGAMCVSISGRCFISQFLYGRSANRGDCIQPCRRAYNKTLLQDKEENNELLLGNDYVMSPKDLCTLPFLDKIIPYVDSIKIEGRAKSPEYIKKVITAYRKSIDAIFSNNFNKEFIDERMKEVSETYNRGFSDGFYMGKPINEFTDEYGPKSNKRKHTLGKVINFYKKINVAEIEITANKIKKGDTILIIGNKTGVLEQDVNLIIKDENNKQVETNIGKKGEVITIKLDKIVRKNDFVYLWK